MTLVACNNCGSVYDKEIAGDHVRCPQCDLTTRKITSVPKLGNVNKWWHEVDL